MSLLLNRRQCEMLAEMGVRAYLPQCRNRRLAPESASQPDCNAALAGKGLAKGASNAAAEQANALPSAPAPLAAPPALQQAYVAAASSAGAPQAKARTIAPTAPIADAAAQSKPTNAAESAQAPHCSQQAPFSLCLGLQRSGQGGKAGADANANANANASADASADAAPVRWLFVCDALPEDGAVRAAQGNTGVLLRNMAAAVGVQLEQGSRSPAPTADAAWLLHEIARLQPQIIVALGRPAAAGLLGSSQASGRLRGQIHRLAVPAHEADLQAALAHIPVIFSYPLDFLLREPQNKANAWQDLCLAWSLTAQMR